MEELSLPLNKRCFDLIESGKVKEDYREIKDFWIKRIIDLQKKEIRHYDTVRFYQRYTTRTMTFELKSIEIGRDSAWAKFPFDVFIIKLGDRIK